jgi:predicted RND superfamily exporter protein
MKSALLRIYDKCILEHPILTLIVTFGVLVFFALQVPKFKLDASGDSLLLENDTDLYYHRQITERYRAKDILVLTYTPRDDLFSASSLNDLAKLRDELRQIKNVSSITTILDVPILLTSGVSLGDLADEENIKTLENFSVDRSTALAEFNDNPLYSGRLLSPDGKTTALLISLPFDETYRSLLKHRYELREKEYNNDLSAGETQELNQVSYAYRQELTRLMQRDNQLVEDVRAVVDRHRDQAELYLGGVPMIVYRERSCHLRNGRHLFPHYYPGCYFPESTMDNTLHALLLCRRPFNGRRSWPGGLAGDSHLLKLYFPYADPDHVAHHPFDRTLSRGSCPISGC